MVYRWSLSHCAHRPGLCGPLKEGREGEREKEGEDGEEKHVYMRVFPS